MVGWAFRYSAAWIDRFSYEVKETYKAEEEKRAEKRRNILSTAHARQEALKQKLQLEKEKLSNVHLVSTVEELNQSLLRIDSHKNHRVLPNEKPWSYPF